LFDSYIQNYFYIKEDKFTSSDYTTKPIIKSFMKDYIYQILKDNEFHLKSYLQSQYKLKLLLANEFLNIKSRKLNWIQALLNHL
jgi:hypothetical protein